MATRDDCYVIDTRHHAGNTHPVLFLDHERSVEELLDTPAFVAASGVWPFSRFLLLEEIEFQRGNLDYHWPFSKESVLAEDPALALYDGNASLPWECD